MADLARDGWELESAEDQADRNRETFHLPSVEDRSGLEPGQLVKLLFVLRGEDETGDFLQPERMWVEVRAVTEDGYEGVLASDPATPTGLAAGDVISFGAEHVAEVADR